MLQTHQSGKLYLAICYEHKEVSQGNRNPKVQSYEETEKKDDAQTAPY